MITADSINTVQAIQTPIVKDTVFEPEYLQKNPLYIIYDSADNISCRDYIFSVLKDSSAAQLQRPTLFTDKTYCPNNLKTEENTGFVHNDWVFLLFVFLILLTAVLKRFAGNTISYFLQGCFSKNQVSITTKDGEITNLLALLPVSFIFLPLICIAIYYGIDYFDLQKYYLNYLYNIHLFLKHPFFIWLSIYILLIIAYYTKIALIKMFSQIFRAKKISNYYVQIHLNFSILMGFALFLPVICLVYSVNLEERTILLICLLIVGILYIIKLIRLLFVIISTFKFSYLYLFFYLCTLELLPLIIIGKRLSFY